MNAPEKATNEFGNVKVSGLSGQGKLFSNVQTNSNHRLSKKKHRSKRLGNLVTPEELMHLWRINQEQYCELKSRGLPILRFEDGSTYHPEVAVDAWVRRITLSESGFSSLATDLRRIANHFDPPPLDKVGSDFVANKLGCTTTWIADLVRRGEIPRSCIVPGTGYGKPWKFHRALIEKWIERR